MPAQAAAFVRTCGTFGTVVQVSVEAVGGWEFAADQIAALLNAATDQRTIPVVYESPTKSKVERALDMTVWHAAGAVTAHPDLRGSAWDTEFHSFTQEGATVTGHDDMTDATVWAGAILTNVWRTRPPTHARVAS